MSFSMGSVATFVHYPHTHHVYAVHDADSLYYVGCSTNLEQRRRDLRRNPWFQRDFQITVLATFINRRHAYEYETRIINQERPPYNQTSNPDFIHHARAAAHG
jgi:predicted GIY-YIG superfamily endonuclease